MIPMNNGIEIVCSWLSSHQMLYGYNMDGINLSIIRTNFEPNNQTTLEGLYSGIAELYTLSRTTKVYGSFGSSYSRTACVLTGIELIHVK